MASVRSPFSILLLVPVFGVGMLLAQSERGTITGAVRDASGAVVPGASIQITNVATNVTTATTSNQTGEFTVPGVAAGKYNLRVEKQGFRTFVLSGVTVDAATTVRADANLELGESRQTVEVQASRRSIADAGCDVQHLGRKYTGERSAAGGKRDGADARSIWRP